MHPTDAVELAEHTALQQRSKAFGDQGGRRRFNTLPHEGLHVPPLHLLLEGCLGRHTATAFDRSDHGALLVPLPRLSCLSSSSRLPLCDLPPI